MPERTVLFCRRGKGNGKDFLKASSSIQKTEEIMENWNINFIFNVVLRGMRGVDTFITSGVCQWSCGLST